MVAGVLLIALAGTLVALALTSDGALIAGPDADRGVPGTAPDDDDRDGGDGTDGAPGDGPEADDGSEGGPDPDRDPDRDRDGSERDGSRPGEDLDPLDLDRLSDLDLVYGQLLVDIDASEREMIGFQTEVGEALASASSRAAGLAAVGEVAAERERGLLEVRARMLEPLDDPGAEEVRRLYVEHLDSWADFIGSVAEDPEALFAQSESGATVAINRTADRFARALEEELPEDADAEVARYAEDILDRGFRGFGVADV